jgi:hypothetical protein
MFNEIPFKIPVIFFTEIEKSNIKFIWKHRKSPKTAKAILSQKSNAGGIIIPEFKLYYRAKVLKAASYWHKNRYEDQWTRIEDPDTNPCSCNHLIFDKRVQNMYWEKR